ncbi:hypothetical protein Nepgr_011585 [Nepenthes gracilis]|uniref:Uncharacterized protein n=1 Tax=Nepenthes gracilis TaxID=150966 RepID=A0AAD3SF45_NEPGR|nr:hypothetical protein Nepgr_011585 [Nepenthes gracilis]
MRLPDLGIMGDSLPINQAIMPSQLDPADGPSSVLADQNLLAPLDVSGPPDVPIPWQQPDPVDAGSTLPGGSCCSCYRVESFGSWILLELLLAVFLGQLLRLQCGAKHCRLRNGGSFAYGADVLQECMEFPATLAGSDYVGGG